MASISPVKVAGTVAAIAVSGFLGYAVYFDYMRRHSPEFRKSLRAFSIGISKLLPQHEVEI